MLHEVNVLASTGVYAALSDNVRRGDYYSHNLKTHAIGPAANPEHGPPLWEFSAKCVSDKMNVSVPYADVPAVELMKRN